MDNWQIFSDPNFKLYFKYPAPTPLDQPVEKVESQQADAMRVHISSQSPEVYFEIVKFGELEPEEEYQRHKKYLSQQFKDLTITDLEETRLEPFTAQTYTFAWPEKVRKVVLVQNNLTTYRIIYDPRSTLNLEILSTLKLF